MNSTRIIGHARICNMLVTNNSWTVGTDEVAFVTVPNQK